MLIHKFKQKKVKTKLEDETEFIPLINRDFSNATFTNQNNAIPTLNCKIEFRKLMKPNDLERIGHFYTKPIELKMTRFIKGRSKKGLPVLIIEIYDIDKYKYNFYYQFDYLKDYEKATEKEENTFNKILNKFMNSLNKIYSFKLELILEVIKNDYKVNEVRIYDLEDNFLFGLDSHFLKDLKYEDSDE